MMMTMAMAMVVMMMVMVMMMMKLTRLVSNASVTPSLVNARTRLVWKLAVKLERRKEQDVMIGIPRPHEPWESEMSEPMSGSVDQIFGSEDLVSASKGSHLRNYHH